MLMCIGVWGAVSDWVSGSDYMLKCSATTLLAHHERRVVVGVARFLLPLLF